MKKHLRIIAAVLAAVMLLSVFTASAFAAEVAAVKTGGKSGDIGAGCKWSFDETSGKLTVSGSGPTFDYPYVDAPWAEYALQIQSIEVQNGVTSIGEGLFKNINAVKEAVIADSVTEIGEDAFNGDFNLKKIKLPASLKIISNSMFSYNSSLESIELSDKLEEIGAFAFYGCTALTSVDIPESLKKVGMDAFANSGLSEVKITGMDTEISSHAFGYDYSDQLYRVRKGFKFYCLPGSKSEEYAQALLNDTPPETDVTWEFDEKTGTLTLSGTGETPWVRTEYPAPWSKHIEDITALKVNEGITILNGIGNCQNLRSVTLPNSLKKINSSAFNIEEGCLSSVDFGTGIEEIGTAAFAYAGLKEIVLPESLKKIGSYAFANNKNIKKLDLGSGVEEIGDHAFYECNILSVTIPDFVEKIGEKAFGYYYDERPVEGDLDDCYIYDDFVLTGFEIISSPNSAGARYAKDNGIVLVGGKASINKKSVSLKAGKSATLKLSNSGAYNWYSSDDSVAYVDRYGKVTALRKGSATITPQTPRGIKLSCRVNVTTSPTIKIGKKKFSAKKTYKVKKGKKLTVKISGRASVYSNSYSSSNKKTAKITTKDLNAEKVTIKGFKKGKATIKLKVNGSVTFKIKVKVY